jgi:hypothetical protein
MKFWKILRCPDSRNYPEVRNYDVVLVIIMTLWGGGAAESEG